MNALIWRINLDHFIDQPCIYLLYLLLFEQSYVYLSAFHKKTRQPILLQISPPVLYMHVMGYKLCYFKFQYPITITASWMYWRKEKFHWNHWASARFHGGCWWANLTIKSRQNHTKNQGFQQLTFIKKSRITVAAYKTVLYISSI